MSAPETMITWSGTRHNLSNIGTGVRRRRAACSTSIWMYEHDQTRTHRRDCKRCFPPSPDFSSSTLTDLQKLTDERDQARDIAVRLEEENAELRQRVETEWFNGNLAAGARDRLLAPVDGER